MTTNAPRTVRLSEDVRRRVDEVARVERRSFSNMLAVLVERGLAERDPSLVVAPRGDVDSPDQASGSNPASARSRSASSGSGAEPVAAGSPLSDEDARVRSARPESAPVLAQNSEALELLESGTAVKTDAGSPRAARPITPAERSFQPDPKPVRKKK